MARKKETKTAYEKLKEGDFVKIAPRFLHLLPVLPGRVHTPASFTKNFGDHTITVDAAKRITAYDLISFLQILQRYFTNQAEWQESEIKIPLDTPVVIPIVATKINIAQALKARGVKNTTSNRLLFLNSILRLSKLDLTITNTITKHTVFLKTIVATAVNTQKPWQADVGVALSKVFVEASIHRGLVVSGLQRIFSYSGRGATYAVLIDLYLQANSTLRNITEDRICKDLVIQLKNPKKTHEIIRLAFKKIAAAGGQKWSYDRQKKQWIREG